MDKETETIFAKNCNHVFVEDMIDTMFPYKEGVYIRYCEYCGLSDTYIKELLNQSKKLNK